MQSGAAEGFVPVPHPAPDALDFVDRVVPFLQERGVLRAAYPGITLRSPLGLGEPDPGLGETRGKGLTPRCGANGETTRNGRLEGGHARGRPAPGAPAAARGRCPWSLPPRGRANSGQPRPGRGGAARDTPTAAAPALPRRRRAADRTVLLDTGGCWEEPRAVRGASVGRTVPRDVCSRKGVRTAHTSARRGLIAPGPAPCASRRAPPGTARPYGATPLPPTPPGPCHPHLPADERRARTRTPQREAEPGRTPLRLTRDGPRQPRRHHASGAVLRAMAPHGRKAPLRGRLARRILPNSACQGHNVTGIRTHPRVR